MTWRYTTLPDCSRVWRWYATVGAPEPVLAAVACVRAAAVVAALALPQITEHTRAGWHPMAGSAIPASRVVRGSQSELVPTERYVAPSAYLAAGGSPALYSSIPAWTPSTFPGLHTDNPAALSFAPSTPIPEPGAGWLLLVPVLAVIAARLMRQRV